MRYIVAGVRADAAAEHLKLLMEKPTAMKRRAKAGDDRLAVAIGNARQKRESARIAIREHEAGIPDSACGRTAGS
jgi:hypothetical protein